MAEVKVEESSPTPKASSTKSTARSRTKDGGSNAKRKCVSTACIACRRRKSKCDGNLPSCAACASVYGTECVYDPNSDHRRKGVYKKGVDSTKTQDSTLKILVEGILNYPEHEVMQLVKQIRSCESLEDVAQSILTRNSQGDDDEDDPSFIITDAVEDPPPRFERELSGKLGELKLKNGATQFLGGTSNLLYVDNDQDAELSDTDEGSYPSPEDAIKSWTTVTSDTQLILHLLNLYFTWHYTYFTTLSKSLFFRDFLQGKPQHTPRSKPAHCTPLLVNAMLTLGCHFTSWPAARADPEDSATAGDHFHRECRRILVDDEDYEIARTATIQALALMSVREAGCGREAKGWFYSGMSFRMACDMGLPFESSVANLADDEVDARRMTFWGCYLFDKCWSNYLGRAPQLALENITLKKFDVFPSEDSDAWMPWTDTGPGQNNAQPVRTRAVSLQISALCEISSDLLHNFYRPGLVEKPLGRQAEVQKLSDLQIRLEAWRTNLPKEFEAKEGQLPHIFVMHMFSNLLFIHLFRPFLKYSQSTSPLPSHVSPKKQCTQAAANISKYVRMYKKTHGLRQICNIAVYIIHSACTIHLLNLQDKNSQRDFVHGLTHLEEIAESWLCARRTLGIIVHQAEKWQIDIPEDARKVLARADETFQFTKMKHGGRSDAGSPAADIFTQQGAFPSDNPLSPANFGRFDFPLANVVASSPQTPSHPPISQNARVRSNSSARRTELLRQMQQNSLQSQVKAQDYAYQAMPDQRSKWNNTFWKNAIHVNTAPKPNDPGGAVAQVAQNDAHAGGSQGMFSNDSPDHSSVASPSAVFPGGHQQKALFEEQKNWWYRDQSALFDHWMRRDSINPGASAPATQEPAASQGTPEAVGTGVYAGFDGSIIAGTSAGLDAMTATNMAIPPNWNGFSIPDNADAQQGNSDNFGGYNTGIL